MLSVLKKNLPLKVLSVVLAIFLWFLVSGGKGGGRMEVSLGVPLELHNLPPEMEVVKGPVERVDVRLSGPRRIVSKISKLGIYIPLDLTGAAEGETTFEIFTSDIKVPETVTVTRVSPSSVSVILERIIKKRVRIVIPVEGTPKDGFKALEPVISPDTIEIKGLRSKVDRINSLKTAPVNIDGATKDVVGEAPVIFPEGGSVHATSRSSVQYRVPLVKGNKPSRKNT